MTSSSLWSLQSGAPLQSFFISTHSPLEQWNSPSSQDPSSTSLETTSKQCPRTSRKVSSIQTSGHAIHKILMHSPPADDSHSLVSPTTRLQVEAAFPEACIVPSALEIRNRDCSVPASSLHHLDNMNTHTFCLDCSKVHAP